ncbi:PAS domain-containing sensor histidine kinase [Novosphingobium sp. TCA1]|uniref:hybrid sensor histidine kinase/response regulator n=1 Tax=Novosphingobium sp. TCA1 TaxID=2682474 RepID=UPI00130A67B1|nr:PAS domain-containing protein [Novosphingobium sp. TCA1]GFE74527.1 histidine kinase [Novosphingobium sp. TCA1]
MSERIRRFDWGGTALGERQDWPVSLRTAVDMATASHFAMFVAWGDEHTFLYNDAYAPFLGARHPAALGKPMREVWPEIWDELEPLIDRTRAGETISVEDMHLVMTRNGADEDTWWTFCYSPLRDDAGEIGGVLDIAVDTTQKFIDSRRIALEGEKRAESESRFGALVEATSDAIYRMSADWQEMHQLDGRGFLLDTLESRRSWIDVYLPEDERAVVLAAIDEAVRTKSPFILEHRVVQADGEIGWTASHAVPILDADGGILEWFGTATDVTQAHEARDALATSREKLELATRAARLGQFDFWPQDGRLEWDDRCRELFGLSPGAAVTYESAYLAGLHPDDRENADEAVRIALDPQGTGIFDTEYRTIGIEDGIERHVHAQGLAFFKDGRPIRLIGTVQDVTADRARQTALREVEERLRLAGRATNDAVWDWDFRHNHVTWNDALRDIYLHEPEAVAPTGEWWLEHIHPEDRQRVDDSIHAVIDGSGTDWSDEYRFRRADGRYADVLDRGYVLRDMAGTPLRMVGAMLDVSDRKAIERQLESDRQRLTEEVQVTTAERDKAEEALRQSQKMEAVGQLTGGLAHDFNNLLTGISGALEMMQMRIAQGRVAEIDKYSVAAQGAVRRAAALTHRLLAFSRRQTLDPKPTSVNRLIFDLEELVRRTVGPQIEVETVGKAGLWMTLVDPNQLENALLNLCINARDAMPDGGRITIETANRWLDHAASRERDLEPGQYISISVTDTGSGMSPEVISRAFDPFFTTKPIGEGTGLGLSMIYGFARQSGGHVRIQSEVGMGTTMSIYLPRYLADEDCREGTADAALVAGLENMAEARTGRVMVVDDEPTVRMLVAEVAQELGYSVMEAFDGPSAMRLLQAGSDLDLLITDVGLPGGMNGRQVADAALALMPDLNVLFITGYAENAVIGNGQLAPNMALITKPFAMEALAQRIREIMG